MYQTWHAITPFSEKRRQKQQLWYYQLLMEALPSGTTCTVLWEAEKLRRCIYSDEKRVISFDLQFYIKATQMQERNDVKNKFVFWIPELHAVFFSLKVTGKLMVVNWSKCLKKQVTLNFIQRELDDFRLAFCTQQ